MAQASRANHMRATRAPGGKGLSFGCLLAVLAFASQSTPARDWVAYTSDNFTVYSDRSEKSVLATLERFELFRHVALVMLDAPDQPDSARLRIFLFDKNVDFNRVKGKMDVSGFFYRSLSGARMLVAPDGDDDTLFHEHVHYVMHRHSNVNYPRWYAEGLAEALGTIEFTDSSVRVGMPSGSYQLMASLQLLGESQVQAPVREMISVEPRVGALPFYATAWLMVDYLLIDSADDPERLQMTADYLLRFDAGEDPVEAFEVSFGISPEEMDERLDNYSRARQFKTIVFPSMEYGGTMSARELEDDEELYLLADLAVELGEYDAAETYFDQFRRRGRGSSLAPRMQAIQAITHAHRQRMEDGDALVEQLLALDANDADGLAKIIHYSIDRALYAREHGEESSAFHVNRSIAIGELVLRQNPGHLETLYYLGRAYEISGDLESAASRLLEFYAIEPTMPVVNLLLAKIFNAGGNTEVGSDFLYRVYSASHSEEARAELDEIQERIQDAAFVAARIERLLAEGHGSE